MHQSISVYWGIIMPADKTAFGIYN